VKATLEFLRKRQRADGKMMHELSQSAGIIRWFEDYGYGYYHADTTPLYIIAVRDYVQASGDTAMARDFWPSMRKAYDYCATTDEAGDGLMDNTKAGVGAAETGSLRRRDILTDVFLATVWTEAAGAAGDLARIADPPFAATADEAFRKARASLNRRFLDDGKRMINYAVMKDGTGQAEQTVWPAVGLWRNMFDPGRPAVEGMLDELARAGIASDWGARMLSKDSKLYQPLGYNNGAVWPFLTGFAALALYNHHRAPAAWQYLDGTADLTFLEPRGYIPELLSGDRLRTIDAAVPHQLFATNGFMSTLIRGLMGLNPAEEGRLRIAPQLPDDWSFFRLKNVRWRDARLDVGLKRDGRQLAIGITPRAGRPDLVLDVTLPPGTEQAGALPKPAGGAARREITVQADARGTHVRVSGRFDKAETLTVNYLPGIQLTVPHEPLRVGDVSQRLRVIDARLDGRVYTLRLQGRRERVYPVHLTVPFQVMSIDGAREVKAEGPRRVLDVALPAGPGDWAETTVTMTLGPRMK
jgi:hypothetical protein